MGFRELRKLICVLAAAVCLADVIHCSHEGDEHCAKAGCSAQCCMTARDASHPAGMTEPDRRPEYRPAAPEPRVSEPAPEDIFHPPAV